MALARLPAFGNGKRRSGEAGWAESGVGLAGRDGAGVGLEDRAGVGPFQRRGGDGDGGHRPDT